MEPKTKNLHSFISTSINHLNEEIKMRLEKLKGEWEEVINKKYPYMSVSFFNDICMRNFRSDMVWFYEQYLSAIKVAKTHKATKDDGVELYLRICKKFFEYSPETITFHQAMRSIGKDFLFGYSQAEQKRRNDETNRIAKKIIAKWEKEKK